MGTSPLPEPQKSPPLGGTVCPDPRWNSGRGLVLQGWTTFLGVNQVLTAWAAGQPAVSMGTPPPLPPGISEGSIPFAEQAGLALELVPPDIEGSTAFVDEDTAT